MVHVEEPIDMLRVAHHFGMKQSASMKLERLYEFLFLSLKVRDLFDGKAEILIFQIDGLQRLSLITQLNAGEKNRMSLYRCLNGTAQTVSINTAVKDIKKREVIENLIFVMYAFGINT